MFEKINLCSCDSESSISITQSMISKGVIFCFVIHCDICERAVTVYEDSITVNGLDLDSEQLQAEFDNSDDQKLETVCTNVWNSGSQ